MAEPTDDHDTDTVLRQDLMTEQSALRATMALLSAALTTVGEYRVRELDLNDDLDWSWYREPL